MAAGTLRRRESAGLVAGAVAAAGGLVVVPLVRLAWSVLGDNRASLSRVLSSPGFGRAAAHSFELALVVPLIALPVGTALALFLRRPDVPFRRTLRALTVLPLLVPQFVLGYSWTQSYGRAGFTDHLVGVHWTGLAGPAGVFAVLVVDAVPVCYLLTTVGLATRAQPELDMAARTSGASECTVLRTVVLPLLRPVLAAEFVLISVTTMESFAAPQVLGTPVGYATLTTRIYADLALASDPAAFTDAITLALGLALVAVLLLLPADLLLVPRLRSSRVARPGLGGAPTGRRLPVVLGSALVAVYGLLGAVLPTVALVAASLTRAVGVAPTPSNWTLDNFRQAMTPETRAALAHSLQLAALAAVVLALLGVVAAALERFRAGRAVGTLVTLSFAVPGSALAVGLLIAYDRAIGGTLLLILLAYLAKFWALAHRTISGAMDRVPDGEWQAARASGAGPLATARTVWLPAMKPALLGAAVLVFAAALHEVTMSSLLYSTGTETFAVAVLNSQELGRTPITAAQSVVLTAVVVAVIVPLLVIVRLGARTPRRSTPRRAEPAHAG